MPNIIPILNEHIRRLARREIKGNTSVVRRATAQYRRDIAALKRQVASLGKTVAFLEAQEKRRVAQQPVLQKTEGVRFCAMGSEPTAANSASPPNNTASWPASRASASTTGKAANPARARSRSTSWWPSAGSASAKPSSGWNCSTDAKTDAALPIRPVNRRRTILAVVTLPERAF